MERALANALARNDGGGKLEVFRTGVWFYIIRT